MGLLVCMALAGSAEGRMSDWEAQMWPQWDVPGKMGLVVKMYYDGRPADAAEAIKKLVGEGLSDEEMVKAADKLAGGVQQEMVANPATADAVKVLIEAVEKAVVKLRTDQAYIDSVVAKVRPGDGESWQAVQRCMQLGEYAVPSLVGALAGTDDKSVQVAIGKTLVLMGSRAVRPLCEGAWLSEPAAVEQVCGILGDIRSELALGVLSEVLGDRERTAEVRKAAASAIVKIRGTGHCKVPEQATAAGYYYALADAYLHGSSFTLRTMEGTTLPVWNWSAESKRIEGREVPAELYGAKMAEKCCAAGLRTDKENTPLRALMLSSLFAQKLVLVGKPVEETDRGLKTAILVGGEQALYGSLGKSLADGDAGLAILACQTLGGVTTGKGIPAEHRQVETNPLLAALVSSDRPVRLAAAQAIVAQGPTRLQGEFEESDKVLPALSWGLMYEMPTKYVLVATPTDAVAATYRGLLTKAGYRVGEALTEPVLLAKAGELSRPDWVILDSSMVGSLGQLRMVLLDPGVHVLVIEEGAEAGKYAEQGVVGVVGTSPSDKELEAAMGRAPKAEEEAKLVSDLLANISQRSAESLASINAEAAPYRMMEVVPALREALGYEQDAIRVPTLKALGSIGAMESTADVLAVATKAENSKPVRLAALEALGAIYEGSSEVSPDAFARLVPVTDDQDPEIAVAASRAVALAKFNADQFADLVLKKRVEEIKAGAKD